jgi:hypothetical protein
MVLHFWKPSSSTNLTGIQQRFKWYFTRTNIQIGDVVLLKDEHISLIRWKLGSLAALYAGQVRIVRTVYRYLSSLKNMIIHMNPNTHIHNQY